MEMERKSTNLTLPDSIFYQICPLNTGEEPRLSSLPMLPFSWLKRENFCLSLFLSRLTLQIFYSGPRDLYLLDNLTLSPCWCSWRGDIVVLWDSVTGSEQDHGVGVTRPHNARSHRLHSYKLVFSSSKQEAQLPKNVILTRLDTLSCRIDLTTC